MALYMTLPLAILAVVTALASAAPAPEGTSIVDYLRCGGNCKKKKDPCCPEPEPEPCCEKPKCTKKKCPKKQDSCDECAPKKQTCGCDDDDDDDDDDDECCRRRMMRSFLTNYYRRGGKISLPNLSSTPNKPSLRAGEVIPGTITLYQSARRTGISDSSPTKQLLRQDKGLLWSGEDGLPTYEPPALHIYP